MLYTALSQGQKNVQTLQSLQTRIDLCMLHRKTLKPLHGLKKKKTDIEINVGLTYRVQV